MRGCRRKLEGWEFAKSPPHPKIQAALEFSTSPRKRGEVTQAAALLRVSVAKYTETTVIRASAIM
jgi:hypothetical protein